MKQPRIKPQFNHIHVYSRNHLWQIDLVDFSKFSHWNRGYKYLLCAIDVYSRKSFVVPLKRKSDAHLGMGSILMKTKPVLIQSDNGTEFISKEFQHVLNKHTWQYLVLALYHAYRDPTCGGPCILRPCCHATMMLCHCSIIVWQAYGPSIKFRGIGVRTCHSYRR